MIRRSRLAATLATMLTIIAAAALLPRVAGAGGGGCHDDHMTDSMSTTVVLSGNCMNPTIARVAPGDTVTFLNKDSMSHTVTGALMLWGSMEELQQGDQLTHTFDDEGVYPYYCFFHPGMAGAVVVGGGESAAQASTGGVAPDRLLLARSDPPSGAGSAAASPTASAPATPDNGIGWGSITIAAAVGAALSAVIAVLAYARRGARRRAPAP